MNRMAEIYSQAQEVFVWLGEEDAVRSNDCAAFWALKLIAQFAMDYVDYAKERPPSVAVEDLFSFLGSALSRNASEGSCPCGDSWDIIRDHHLEAKLLDRVAVNIWARPWFQRLWVIQETTKAASVTYYLGPHEIAGRDLGLAAEVHMASIERISRIHGIHLFQKLVERAWRLLTMEIHCSEFAGQRQNLLHQILQTSDFLATDLHDR